MAGSLQRLRENRTAAHVVPFLVFMVFVQLSVSLKIDNSLLPWYRRAPELWIYPIQTILCLALIGFFWRNYEFRFPKGWIAGIAIGVFGIALWILPAILFAPLGVADWAQPAFAETLHGLPFIGGDENEPANAFKYLGLTERLEGFDPTIVEGSPLAYWATVIMRFLRMVVAVALIEEIFWRGFLMRYLATDKPFWKIPFGTWKPLPFFLVAFFFMLVHQPADWLMAFSYGLLINALAVWKKSLFACVVCHAVSNLILGIYVMATRQWGFW